MTHTPTHTDRCATMAAVLKARGADVRKAERRLAEAEASASPARVRIARSSLELDLAIERHVAELATAAAAGCCCR